jgi:uncharacterized protein
MLRRLLLHSPVFAWDEAKDAANRQKLGIAFADILPIFDSMEEQGVVIEDDRYDCAKIRLWMICPFQGKIHHVTFTKRDEVIRLISARRASWREEQEYDRRKPR